MSSLFMRQLASYAAVHRDARNKATHFVGIPTIVFSLLLVLALWQIPLGGAVVSGALAVGIVGVLGWIALDFGIGLVMAAIMAPLWLLAEELARQLGITGTWALFAALFVGGWALQFLGHHYEGKRPALLDNLFQAFIGPMFLVAETMVALGWRRDLDDAMHASVSAAPGGRHVEVT
jgi:uncharacterized membrane protein YGL010W